MRHCEGAERPSPRERSDRAGGGCGREEAFAILNFKLCNLVHTKVTLFYLLSINMIIKHVDKAFVDHALTSYINEFTGFFCEIFARERSYRAGVGEGCPPPTVGSFYTYFTNITNSIHIYREESSTLQEHLLNFYAQASDHLKLKYFYMVTYGYNYIDLLYFSSSKCISH